MARLEWSAAARRPLRFHDQQALTVVSAVRNRAERLMIINFMVIRTPGSPGGPENDRYVLMTMKQAPEPHHSSLWLRKGDTIGVRSSDNPHHVPLTKRK
ncbi:hypothetical protein BKA01_001713 [Pseudonocardia eucalypti]|uniref:hypothetical protein n=1 Tax=Pseudonocardia eucalypti TaxID=648755 RepID=UPI00160C8A9E|nr:hypothetical protein [Pseudonocardia eucalypti]